MRRAILILLAITLLFTGCASSLSHDTYEKIYKRYNSLGEYSADVSITANSNKGDSTYKVLQTYSPQDAFSSKIVKPDNMADTEYKIENDKMTFTSPNGQSVTIADYVSEDEDFTSIAGFFERYFTSEDAFAETSGINDNQTRLQVMITPGSRERFSQSMWIDNKTLDPVRLITYDINGEETLTAEIERFEME